jgi:hypothetical protein
LGYQHRFYDLPMGSHMTNEKRNTAIMDKVKRYTQHHTATPNLAQEAIERIAMTNDKDSAMPIMQIQSSETFKELFRINADGTVTGDIENASEDALRMAREALRNIQIEAEREQGSWVHLKRVIALNCKQTLAALKEKGQ